MTEAVDLTVGFLRTHLLVQRLGRTVRRKRSRQILISSSNAATTHLRLVFTNA
jgi:hypothetical protein